MKKKEKIGNGEAGKSDKMENRKINKMNNNEYE